MRIEDKELKEKLLEMLMEDMDSAISSKLKPKSKLEPMMEVVEIKKESVEPELSLEKEDSEDSEKELPESSMMVEKEEEEDEDYGDSRLMQKLKELKAKKSC